LWLPALLLAQDIELAPPAAPEVLAFCPDGTILVTLVHSQTLLIAWDAATGKKLYEFAGTRGNKYGILFSSDGRRIVLPGCGGHPTAVLDAASGRVLREFKSVNSYSYALSPDGAFLACVDADSDSAVLYSDVGKETIRVRADHGMVAFSTDGKSLLVLRADSTLALWDVENAKETARLGDPLRSGHADLLGPAAILASPDGKRWVTATVAERYKQGGDNRGEQGTREVFIDVWDAVGRKRARRIAGDDVCVARMGGSAFVQISPDASLACMSLAGGPRWVDLTLGKDLFRLPAGRPVEFSEDGRRLLMLEGSDPVLVDVQTGKKIRSLKGKGRAALSRDGRRIAYCADDKVRLVSVEASR
jgi:WD40 repeat protein